MKASQRLATSRLIQAHGSFLPSPTCAAIFSRFGTFGSPRALRPNFSGGWGFGHGWGGSSSQIRGWNRGMSFPLTFSEAYGYQKTPFDTFWDLTADSGRILLQALGGRGGFCCLDHVPSSSMFPAWIIPRNWLKFIRSHWEVAGMFIIIFFLGWLSIMIYPLRFLIVGQSHYNDPLLLLVNPIIIHDNP